MQARAKAFNPQIFLESLCYCGFGGLMLYLVSSGKYLSYVTPRMEPYLYFTAIVMGIWALAGLGRLFRPQHKVRSAHCFVLAVPILLLLLPHSPLSTSSLSGNYVGANIFANRSGQSSYGMPQKQAPSGGSETNAATGDPAGIPAESSTEPADAPSAIAGNDPPSEDPTPADSIDAAAPDMQTDASEYEYSSEDSTRPDMQADALATEFFADLPGLDATNKKITVSNDNFGLWLSEIYMNMEKYKGYTVIMTGFVFKDPEMLKEDEFVPARLMMSCCTADLAPAGLLCKYAGVPGLKAESWVTVEGTLFIGQYEYDGVKYDDPQISVTKITPAEAAEGYIYPYY